MISSDSEGFDTSVQQTSCTGGKSPPYQQVRSVSLSGLPSLKKPRLDLNLPSSYRPISDLTFMSKLTKRVVAVELLCYLEGNGLMSQHQSGFCRGHSTETLLIHLLSDIHQNMDSGRVALLALLDVSAAFDSVSSDTAYKTCGIIWGRRVVCIGLALLLS